MRDYDGICWTQSHQWKDGKERPVDPASWGLRVLESRDKPGLSREQGVIHRGQNSGYQAINLAYLLGAERIILLGFDMMMYKDQRHWFGDHPAPLNMASDYATFALQFDTIKPEDYGLEILNCSRRTTIRAFPIHDLNECLASL